MKYTQLTFHLDENGKRLKNPRVITAKDLNCKEIEITEDHNSHAWHHKSPGGQLQFRRGDIIKLKDDPWCECGATYMLFTIFNPVISFGPWGTILIAGFENPALICAGKLVEPYDLNDAGKRKARPWARFAGQRHFYAEEGTIHPISVTVV